jgi:hypothetical protein
MTQTATMSSAANEQGVLPVVSLQSKDHEELLNIIDKLRSQGISRYIDLPQLIVCGDQSSGKSSVLEAVSGLRFPTKDNLCTRFATELILRRVATESATVTIVPDPSRSEQEIAKLSAFKPSTTVYDDFGSIIEEAGEAMGLGSTKVFSTDILRVEISGPTQPHLTLVDLPGLFHAGNKAVRTPKSTYPLFFTSVYCLGVRWMCLSRVAGTLSHLLSYFLRHVFLANYRKTAI